MERLAYSVQEIADLLSSSPRTVVRMIEGGELRGFRLRAQWRVSADALREYIERGEARWQDDTSAARAAKGTAPGTSGASAGASRSRAGQAEPLRDTLLTRAARMRGTRSSGE